MDPAIELDEHVQVVATFGEGLSVCFPRLFRRANGREVRITELGLRHPTTQGRRTMHVFEVTDGGTDYRLEFDSERLKWRLIWECGHV